MMKKRKVIVQGISRCSRCTEDHDGRIEFTQLSHPVRMTVMVYPEGHPSEPAALVATRADFDYTGICPTTNEPILMRFTTR
jgi:hypothetical protein